MGKFKNKYRSESHRRPFWDYSANALYFLTVVTQHRICNLGEILRDTVQLQLSEFGKIVESEWYKSFDIRQELFLDEFIMMPNHLHAIVEIRNLQHTTTYASQSSSVIVPIQPIVDIDKLPHPPIKRNPPIRLPKSISSFLGGFKSSVNTQIDNFIDAHELKIPKYNRKNHFFQNNYHDHIIRNEIEYWHIKKYIVNNPANWINDTFHPS